MVWTKQVKWTGPNQLAGWKIDFRAFQSLPREALSSVSRLSALELTRRLPRNYKMVIPTNIICLERNSSYSIRL